MSLSAAIKGEARRLGFTHVGIVPVGPALSHPFYQSWLAAGYAGEMAYLQRHAPLKQNPAALAPWARSLIVLTLNYHRPWPELPDGGAPRGRISQYAWGKDYHEVIGEKLSALAAAIASLAGKGLRTRSCVDAAPLMEREFAARAGLGWVGKNGNLIFWEEGSWFFLAELLVELELDYDFPVTPRQRAGDGSHPPDGRGEVAFPIPALGAGLAMREHCGSCTACIRACPTQAIVADKTVDARRCISYLTIELKGPIPVALRPAMGDWVFGCDVCQDVCPWNRKATFSDEPSFGPVVAEDALPGLAELLGLDQAGFQARFRGTPLARPRRSGLLRNAAIALGNTLGQGGQSDPTHRGKAMNALLAALHDPEPLVRGAAAWALGKAALSSEGADLDLTTALAGAVKMETDPDAKSELETALGRLK